MVQHLVEYDFKTAEQNSTNFHTTLSQHVLNHILNFQSQSQWTTKVKKCVKKSIIVDTTNIECVWHAICVTTAEII